MKIAFISGKDGSGKTAVARLFAEYLKKDNKKIALIDCDMNRGGLLSSFEAEIIEKKIYSRNLAAIDTSICIHCNYCLETCEFGAIDNKDQFIVSPTKCVGCRLCADVCPPEAVSIRKLPTGERIIAQAGKIKIAGGRVLSDRANPSAILNGILNLADKFEAETGLVAIDGLSGLDPLAKGPRDRADLLAFVYDGDEWNLNSFLEIARAERNKIVVIFNELAGGPAGMPEKASRYAKCVGSIPKIPDFERRMRENTEGIFEEYPGIERAFGGL